MKIGLWMSRSVRTGQTDWIQDYQAYWIRMHKEGASFFLCGARDSLMSRAKGMIERGVQTWTHRLIGTQVWEPSVGELDAVYVYQTGKLHGDIPERIDSLCEQLISGLSKKLVLIDTDSDFRLKADASYIGWYFVKNWFDKLANAGVQVIIKSSSQNPHEWPHIPYAVGDGLPVRDVCLTPELGTFFVGASWQRSDTIQKYITKTLIQELKLPVIIHGPGWNHLQGTDPLLTIHGTQFFDWTGSYFDDMNKSAILVDYSRDDYDYGLVRTCEYYYSGTPVVGRLEIGNYKLNPHCESRKPQDLYTPENLDRLRKTLDPNERKLMVDEERHVIHNNLHVDKHYSKFVDLTFREDHVTNLLNHFK